MGRVLLVFFFLFFETVVTDIEQNLHILDLTGFVSLPKNVPFDPVYIVAAASTRICHHKQIANFDTRCFSPWCHEMGDMMSFGFIVVEPIFDLVIIVAIVATKVIGKDPPVLVVVGNRQLSLACNDALKMPRSTLDDAIVVWP